MLMEWKEVQVTCQGEDALSVSELFKKLGARAVAFKKSATTIHYEDTAKISRFHPSVVAAVFAENEITDNVLAELQTFGQVTKRRLTHPEWKRLSVSQFQPLSFNNHINICPTWISVPSTDALIIRIDPGPTFGTGKHPTTALCIEWLVQHFSDEKIVIDYGCGSGILGLIAYKLGAEKIYGVDNDEAALQTTQTNILLNQISAADFMTFLPKKLPAIQVDLLIANMLFAPLMALAPHFKNLLKPNGKILLSGMTESEIPDIISQYQPDFSFDPPTIREGWGCLAGRLGR